LHEADKNESFSKKENQFVQYSIKNTERFTDLTLYTKKFSSSERQAINIDFSIHVNYHLFLFHPTFAQDDYTLTTGSILFLFFQTSFFPTWRHNICFVWIMTISKINFSPTEIEALIPAGHTPCTSKINKNTAQVKHIEPHPKRRKINIVFSCRKVFCFSYK